MNDLLELLVMLVIFATIAGFATSILVSFLRLGWVLAPFIAIGAAIVLATQLI